MCPGPRRCSSTGTVSCAGSRSATTIRCARIRGTSRARCGRSSMAAVDRALTRASLRVTPRMLREMTRDCTLAHATTPPKPGEWAIVDVVRHLVEGDRDTFLPRLRRMLSEARPVFPARRPLEHDHSDLATLLD